jgi:hypothetical protein
MVDHLAWARGYRSRAANCVVAARNTTPAEFGKCYRLLADYYGALAQLEEDFNERQIAASRDRIFLPVG